MRFCELSETQARLYETRGVIPNCGDASHAHLPQDEAEKLVDLGSARLIARGRIVRNIAREWSGAKSGGYSVMQMVPVYREKSRAASNGSTPAGKHRAPRLKPGRSVLGA